MKYSFTQEEYPSYEKREEAKSLCSDIFADKSATSHGKANALVNLKIWAHYWRAREAIEDSNRTKTLLRKIRGKKYYKYYVLDIEHYTENWLYSLGDDYDNDIIKCIEEEYSCKPVENKYMPKGHSYYIFDGKVM